MIFINNQPFKIEDGMTVKQALDLFGAILPYAVLHNGDFLPQSKQAETLLSNKDVLEVISAIQGG
ncbi:MAG: sulfur carrier protein ThiS [Gammaproteobacteria bacterium]|nr:sulfur carrier protein ThiS [Gammaproteobacteria bacterium]